MKRTANSPSAPEELADLISSLKPVPTVPHITAPAKTRFELTIDADDPRVAAFAACLTANLLNNFLSGNPTEDDPELLIAMGRLLKKHPEVKAAVQRLASATGESVENIAVALKQLSDFRLYE